LFNLFSNQKFNLIFFDESLDAIDEFNSSLAVDIIKLMESEESSIFIVSHRQYVKEFFNNQLIINSDGKNSWIGDKK
jgi:DNA repair exonuclease SbcCD ATPase subunit